MEGSGPRGVVDAERRPGLRLERLGCAPERAVLLKIPDCATEDERTVTSLLKGTFCIHRGFGLSSSK